MCWLFSPGCDSHSADSTVQVTEVNSCHANIYGKYLRNEDVSFEVVFYFIFHCRQTMMAFHITTICWVWNPALLRNAEPTQFVTNRKPILSWNSLHIPNDNTVRIASRTCKMSSEKWTHNLAQPFPQHSVYSKGMQKSVDVWKTMEECWKWQCQHWS